MSNPTDVACFHEGLEESPSGKKSMGKRFAWSCMPLAYDCCGLVPIWPKPEKGSKVNATAVRAPLKTPIFQSAMNYFLGPRSIRSAQKRRAPCTFPFALVESRTRRFIPL